MFWRFGFASTSTLDTLLDKSNLTVEELLDEDELLQECKAQNGKLVDFLSQKRVIKRLFEHVVGSAEVSGSGGKEWQEKVRFKYPYVASEVLSSEIFAIVETVLANPEDLLDPFWDAILHSKPGHVLPPLPHHSHPLLAGSPSASPIPPGKPFSGEAGNEKGQATPDRSDTTASSSSSIDSSREGSATVVRASDNGPGKSVLAGYWAKVNGVFLDKKPREMLAYIRDLPRIVERFVAHLETPAAVDLLYRIISCEQTLPGASVIDWLSSHDLIPKMVDLLSPTHSVDLHNTVSELLKAIIALSAPSPAAMATGQENFGYGNSASFGGQEQSMGVQNKLVRELASESMVRKMVSFMLDSAHGSELRRKLSTAADEIADANVDQEANEESSELLSFKIGKKRAGLGLMSSASVTGGSAIADDEDPDDTDPQPLNPSLTPAFDAHGSGHRDSTATVRPTNFFPPVRAPQIPVSRETSTSSLITGIGIFIELIRKNNSDYFEQHLFHALRSHLLQRQQEIAAKKAQSRSEAGNSSAPAQGGDDSKDEDDEEMEGMEEAMLELTDKLGIVHLGPMLTALCERLSEFQTIIGRPRSAQEQQILTTLGEINALSFERYRVAELYAELLHCSNMALLNRPSGEGPNYSANGVLQGGIQGLQVLARTLQGADADDASDPPPAVDEPIDVPATPSNISATTNATVTGDEIKMPSATPHGRHTRQASTAGISDGSDLDDVEAQDNSSDPFADVSPSSDHPVESGSTKLEGDITAAENDAKSIRSALSSMSLADLTTPKHSEPPSPMHDSIERVTGDLLKKKFLDCDVIPTILSLFFEYPWNNFFHNVVYDILQQCFNGRMDAGLNRRLTIAVFEKGKLAERILEGQQRNNESMAGPRRIRLGFMGHLNLIAEEAVKLLERYPHEIGDAVSGSIPQPAWDNFVNESLKENREKESAPLAGGKPMTAQFGFAGASSGQAGGEDDDSGRLGIGASPSGDNETFANYLSAQMGGTSSDDDDSDEEASWLTQDPRSSGFADAFQPGGINASSVTATTKVHEDQEDDDDEWGPFSASEGGSGANTSSQLDFRPSTSQPLTAADWAASAFDRSGSPEDDFSNNSALGGEDEEEEEEEEGGASSSEEQYPFVDLSDATSYRIAQAGLTSLQRRRSSSGHGSSTSGVVPPVIGVGGGRRRASSSASSAGSTDPSAAQAANEESPMGPGVSSEDTQVKDGMLIRKLSDGSMVSAPLDDVALAQMQEGQQQDQWALEDD